MSQFEIFMDAFARFWDEFRRLLGYPRPQPVKVRRPVPRLEIRDPKDTK